MAIIKPIKFKGFAPYWWVFDQIKENRQKNTTSVVLALYADSNTYYTDKTNIIKYYEGIPAIPGIGLTDDEIYSALVTNDFFKNCTIATDYDVINNESPIKIQISDCPDTGSARYVECITCNIYWKNNIMIMNLLITYDLHGQTYDDNGVEKVYDLNKEIIWVVDDYYKIPETTIGEFTYFNQLRLNNSLEEVITLGIMYGDQMGYINKKINEST